MSEKRLIIGPCRSGTTMLYRSFNNHPKVEVQFQTIKDGQRNSGTPDYSFFTYDSQKPFVIGKETVGYETVADCTLQVFPNDQAITATRPLFIFRNPRDAFSSWLKQNLVPAEAGTMYFILAFRHVYS